MTDDRDVQAEVVAAWHHRRRGLSVREIATELGVSVSTAHARVKAARDAEAGTAEPDDRAAARVTEAARLDDWTFALEHRMTDQGVAPEVIVPILLRVSARRARLLGLDAPTRVAVSDDRTTRHAPDPEIVAAVADARERAEAERQAIDREHGPAGRPAQRGPTGVVR